MRIEKPRSCNYSNKPNSKTPYRNIKSITFGEAIFFKGAVKRHSMKNDIPIAEPATIAWSHARSNVVSTFGTRRHAVYLHRKRERDLCLDERGTLRYLLDD